MRGYFATYFRNTAISDTMSFWCPTHTWPPAREADEPGARDVYMNNMAIIASMTAAMMASINGLWVMCRSNPNLVPSGSRPIPHFGHFPGPC